MHLSIMILKSDRVLNPKYTLIPASTEHNIEKPNSSRAETGSTIHITLLWHVLSALTTAPGRLGMTMVSAADPELAMYVQLFKENWLNTSHSASTLPTTTLKSPEQAFVPPKPKFSSCTHLHL